MKKIIAVAVLLVLFIFSLACDVVLGDGRDWEDEEYENELRERLEERTGQTFDGWTYEEMDALEAELIRLEEEKEQAQAQEDTQTAEQSQDTNQESTQSQQSQAFESDEGPHKKETGDRNAPSGGYTDEGYDYETETDTPYTEEQTANKSLNGRWQHPDGDIIEINGATGIFIAFGPYWQDMAAHDLISLGMPAFQNIVAVTDPSQISAINKYPDPADDITANADNLIDIIGGLDNIWVCSVLFGVVHGDTEEPLYTFWEDKCALIMDLNGDFIMQYGGTRRTLDAVKRWTYYRME